MESCKLSGFAVWPIESFIEFSSHLNWQLSRQAATRRSSVYFVVLLIGTFTILFTFYE